jgi:hypothetical protein
LASRGFPVARAAIPGLQKFLNHADRIAAMELFVVPTTSPRLLYILLIIALTPRGRRDRGFRLMEVSGWARSNPRHPEERIATRRHHA